MFLPCKMWPLENLKFCRWLSFVAHMILRLAWSASKVLTLGSRLCRDTWKYLHLGLVNLKVVLFLYIKGFVPRTWLALFHQHDSTHVNRAIQWMLPVFVLWVEGHLQKQSLVISKSKVLDHYYFRKYFLCLLLMNYTASHLKKKFLRHNFFPLHS